MHFHYQNRNFVPVYKFYKNTENSKSLNGEKKCTGTNLSMYSVLYGHFVHTSVCKMYSFDWDVKVNVES